MHDINNNHAEVVACIAAFLNSVPLIHSVLPPTEYGSLPTPPAQTPSRQVVDPADGEGTNHLHNRAPSSDNAPSSPDNAYKRAVAIAGRLPRQLGSVNVLSELQRDLQRERDRTRHSAQQEHRTPWLRSQSGEEMGNHSEILEDDDHNLQPSQRFEMAVERYWRVVIAQRYRAALQNKEKRTHSVAEEFGRKYLPDEVKRGLSKKASQDKWKRIIVSISSGSSLRSLVVQACCCCCPENSRMNSGFALSGDDAKANVYSARRLKMEDRATLFATIAATHPTLKDDLKGLTDLLSYFFSRNSLPGWQIPLETLPEANIAALRRRGLGELVSVVDISSHLSVAGGKAQRLKSTFDQSIHGHRYIEDQPAKFKPLSPVYEQAFIPLA